MHVPDTGQRVHTTRMPSLVETAVDTYLRVWTETDPTVRAKLIEQCFAADGRIVGNQVIHGREGLAAEVESFLADPEWKEVWVKGPVDTRAKTFRFYATAERVDGTQLDVFDAGEIDDDGRITLILTFLGRLA